jgi:type II secretory pathway component PulF
MICLSVPEFEELFASFGAELPSVTLFILSSYCFLSFFAIFNVVPCFYLYKDRAKPGINKGRLMLFVVLGFIWSLFVLGFVVIGLYLPIFKIGSEI